MTLYILNISFGLLVDQFSTGLIFVKNHMKYHQAKTRVWIYLVLFMSHLVYDDFSTLIYVEHYVDAVCLIQRVV